MTKAKVGNPIAGIATLSLVYMLSGAIIVACQGQTPTQEQGAPATSPASPTSRPPASAIPPTITETAVEEAPPLIGLTHARPDGNRWAAGTGALPGVEPISLRLEDRPAWIVGAPFQQGVLWVVVTETGLVRAFLLQGRDLMSVDLGLGDLPPGAPPALRVTGEEVSLLRAAIPDAGALSPPYLLQEEGVFVVITENGELSITDGSQELQRFPIRALPDARLIGDGSGRLMLLSGATAEYSHGVLGDPIEASSITILEKQDAEWQVRTLPLPSGKVVEGTAPLWFDVQGDGQREILVTLSDAAQGAQLALLGEDGSLLAAGEPIGQGFRWRQQIAIAPLGPQGEMEIVSDRTPHIGGVVEYFRWEEGRLVPVATINGYASHHLNSRNLDMAVVADLDGEGHLELLIPTQDKMTLAALRRTAESVEEVWRLPADGVIVTNLAAVSDAQGRLALALGRRDGMLVIWPTE